VLAHPLEVTWTTKASASLYAGYDYIAAVNPQAADSLVVEIRARVDQLADQPGLGFKSSVRVGHGPIREIVVGKYRVLYRAEPDRDRLLVLLVWHSSRRNPKRTDF
jgi:plasmid stabilization system protein ParE